MKIIKRPSIPVYRGTCDRCGAVVDFVESEATVIVGNLPTNKFFIDCPMSNCNGQIESQHNVDYTERKTKEEEYTDRIASDKKVILG